MSMKTRAAALAVLIAALALPLAAQAKAKTKMMSVQIKDARLLSKASNVGSKLVKLLKYGDQVTVLETKGDWFRVKAPDGKTEGWMNKSALSAKRIVLGSGQGTAKSDVDSSEVSLAGKGFNKQVENEYKAGGKVDYAWVDKAEGMGLPVDACVAFLREGGLAVEE